MFSTGSHHSSDRHQRRGTPLPDPRDSRVADLGTVSLPVTYNGGRPDKHFIELPAPEFLAFDIDGVLANAPDFLEHAIQIFLLSYDIPKWTAELRVARAAGKDLWQYTREALRGRGITLTEKELSDQLWFIENNTLREERDKVIVSVSALEWLRDQCTVIIWTNRAQEHADEFVNRYLPGMFHGVFGQTEMGILKPRPHGIMRAKRDLGLRGPGFMVGDQVGDMKAAENATLAGLEMHGIGILSPTNGWNRVPDRNLRRTGGARCVFPSANHLLKDIAHNVDPSRYITIKGELDAFEEVRRECAPLETPEFVEYAMANDLEPPRWVHSHFPDYCFPPRPPELDEVWI